MSPTWSKFLSPSVRKCKNNQCVDTPKRQDFLLKNCSEAGAEKTNILGRGGFGIVLKATYKGHKVAVKVVHQRCVRSLSSEENILNWNHVNIVRIFKIVTDINDGLGLVIMERIIGDNLQAILNCVEIGTLSALDILSQVVAGLSFCHQNGIIHRDVKPQNILINLQEGKSKFVAKLGDFGSSIHISRASVERDCRGTIRYMSPEALQRGPNTFKMDIFSLGVTMWQMEARKLPYSELCSNDIIAYRVVREGLRPDDVLENPIIPRILLEGKSLSGNTSATTFTTCGGVSFRRIHSETLLTRNLENCDKENLPRSLNNLLKEAKIENREEILTRKIPWKRIFRNEKWIESNNYRILYKKCWHENPTHRPDASTLLDEFQHLKKNYV